MNTFVLLAAIAGAVFVLSALCVGVVRRYAIRARLVDHPNERSSHSNPTPRGGGLAIVLLGSLAVVSCWLLGLVGTGLTMALVIGGLAVGIVGFLDDRRGLSPAIRFLVHCGAAWFAVSTLETFSGVAMGSILFESGPFGYLLAITALVWLINLFNFMDGIDGIAGSEAAFVFLAAASLTIGLHGLDGAAVCAMMIACACLGFLVWNWPPAKIFMGDVGSGYLGYALGVIGLSSAQSESLPVLVWLILGGVFFIDATLTLLRRLMRGERLYVAHRTHGYQWLSRKWNSHARVTSAVLGVNVLWLLPLAYLSVVVPTQAPWVTAAALIPITLLCHYVGSGRAERA